MLRIAHATSRPTSVHVRSRGLAPFCAASWALAAFGSVRASVPPTIRCDLTGELLNAWANEADIPSLTEVRRALRASRGAYRFAYRPCVVAACAPVSRQDVCAWRELVVARSCRLGMWRGARDLAHNGGVAWWRSGPARVAVASHFPCIDRDSFSLVTEAEERARRKRGNGRCTEAHREQPSLSPADGFATFWSAALIRTSRGCRCPSLVFATGRGVVRQPLPGVAQRASRHTRRSRLVADDQHFASARASA